MSDGIVIEQFIETKPRKVSIEVFGNFSNTFAALSITYFRERSQWLGAWYMKLRFVNIWSGSSVHQNTIFGSDKFRDIRFGEVVS